MSLLKLNLRDFFWLALVIALALCWSLDRKAQFERYARLQNDFHRTLKSQLSVHEMQAIHDAFGGGIEKASVETGNPTTDGASANSLP